MVDATAQALQQQQERESTTTSRSITEITTVDELIAKVKRYVGIVHTLRHDGLVRWFVEYPPPISATSDTVPVLILLHFGGGNMRSSRVLGRTLEKDLWLVLAEQNGYLVLAPNGVAPRKRRGGYNTRAFESDWNDYNGGPNGVIADIDDVGFISALVDWAIQERNGNPKRIYIYGYSNGGTMTERMIIERPNMFAAAAAAVANLPEKEVPIPSRGTPFFLICGTVDPIIPYNGGKANAGRGMVRSAETTRDFFVAANHAGPDMIETILPNVDPNDNCTIISQFFPSNTTPVQFYIMNGGGHNFLGKKMIGGLNYFPRIVSYFLDDYLGNPCYDANGLLLAWTFLTNFTLQ